MVMGLRGPVASLVQMGLEILMTVITGEEEEANFEDWES